MKTVCVDHTSQFKLQLKEKELKVTPARLLVLEVLLHAKKPLSVTEIMHTLNTQQVDLATIYRNVEVLTLQGLIQEVRLSSEKALYEIGSRHHHHAVCTVCGKVVELEACDVSGLEQLAQKASGFKSIASHSLEFFGVCKTCK